MYICLYVYESISVHVYKNKINKYKGDSDAERSGDCTGHQ